VGLSATGSMSWALVLGVLLLQSLGGADCGQDCGWLKICSVLLSFLCMSLLQSAWPQTTLLHLSCTCACRSLLPLPITVVNVVGIIVMISDDGFVVGAVGIVAVGSCAFLVVVSVIADSFARHGCGFAIVCVCVWQWYWMHEAVDSTHWTVWPWLIEKLGWCLSQNLQCSVS